MAVMSIHDSKTQLLDGALFCARHGFAVLPNHTIDEGRCTCGKDCDKPAKHPIPSDWGTLATRDEATIRRWWDEAPIANVGICTGERGGVVMIGPDGAAGVTALAELERQLGALPRTPRARSGGGGEHRYYKWPGGIKNCANANGLPIDVRGEGGQAVAPPSLHKSGTRYEWIDSPDKVPVAELPDAWITWLRNINGKRKPDDLVRSFVSSSPRTGKILVVQPDTDVTARAIAYIDACPGAVSGSNGHDQLYDVARHVVYGFNLGVERGIELLKAHYNSKCTPPWTDAELRHKCQDADTKPYDKPRGWLLGTEPATVTVSIAEDIDSIPLPERPPWPELSEDSLLGLAGEVVRTIAPHTESDPAAVLVQTLVDFGNALGRGPHFKVESDDHHANLFAVIVGQSSRGRKGTGRGRVRRLMRVADEAWVSKCNSSGLSSGEGLIWAVRDAIEKREPIKERGRITGYQTAVVDEGVADKRLLVTESEFALVLRVLQREGNSLSAVMRQAWDTGNLRTMTKNNAAVATGAHISIIGHVTQPELRKYLKDTDVLNGFANRFLWVCSRRSKILPDGGAELDLFPLGQKFQLALAASKNVNELHRTSAAAKLWREVYSRLTSETRTGLYGAVTSRAEAQVLRLSSVYALLERATHVDVAHLRAALALWDYADASARNIFGEDTEDPLAVKVRGIIAEHAEGITRTGIHNALNRNIPAAAIVQALASLRDKGDAERIVNAQTGGRPAERWVLRRNELTKKGKGETLASSNSFLRNGAEEVVEL